MPQEHLAWEAQTQASPERPQQVDGTVMVIELMSAIVFEGLEGLECLYDSVQRALKVVLDGCWELVRGTYGRKVSYAR